MKYILLTLLFTINAQAAETFIRNGFSQDVVIDTVTPANSFPFPVSILNSNGTVNNVATETTLSLLNGKVIKADTDNVTVISSALPSGAATETTLSAINTKTPALVSGRVPVDGSGVTQPISAAALPLPSGASTETTLAAINTKTPALGQAAMAASQPVVIANNQSAVPISAASLPLPAGAATETTLAAVNTKLPAQGQALMAASQPVVIASNQSAVPVSFATPAAVTVKQAAITVGTSAVRLNTTNVTPSSTRQFLNFMLDPASAANCYFGSSSVTTSSTTRGVIIWPGATTLLTNNANDLFAICDQAAQTVFINLAE